MKIYTVVHNEVFADVGDTYRIDAMVQYITDTEEKALKYIKDRYVNSYSWWEVFCGDLDSENVDTIGYFGPRGGKRTGPPLTKQMIEAFQKAKLGGPQH